MARWWLRLPLTVRVFVALAVLVPCLLSMPYALFSHPLNPFGGLAGLGGPVGTLIAARFRDPEYWRLDKGARWRVREVQRTGQPSGDPQLDRLAVGRLSLIVKNEKANAVGLCITFALMLVTPVVAAVRTGHGWWLSAALPGALLLALWSGARRGDRPRVRLNRLIDGWQAALGPNSHCQMS
jgi:hypothetical protein